MKHIISLGAGVQSSTMALMAAKGEITPMPIAGVFADTMGEPDGVMRWLDWMETQLPFPIYRVSYGDLSEDMSMIPFYNLQAGKKGMGQRRCTEYYKVQPVNRKMRLVAGLAPNERVKAPVVTSWVGISIDEVSRMKDSTSKWMIKRHPLIELNMSRQDCLNWMSHNGYPEPAKSACIYCPYTDNQRWKEMKQQYPAEFQRAVEYDKSIRNMSEGMECFVHREAKPLDEAVFTDEDIGQLNMFNDECEGMCGI